MTILQINSSLFNSNGQSSRLADQFVAALRAQNPGTELIVRDLAHDPLPHLDGMILAATHGGNGDTEMTKRSDEAISDLNDADIIVIGMPLFNFGIPSTLKTWLDNIIRPGIAFSYTAEGPKGLMTGKKVYVALASGGVYSEGPMMEYDFAAPYLEKVLGFIGMTDVTIVRAEGTKMPALQDNALQKAMESLAVA